MSRRWLWVDGEGLVEVPVDWKPTPRPRIAVHGVKEPFVSHADGRWYSDSRTYEREVRARGFEVVGNEKAPFDSPQMPKMPPVEQDLLRAADQLGIK